MSPNKSTQGYIMKLEWLLADVTAVRSPEIAEHTTSGVILVWRLFWPIQAVFVVGEPHGGVGTPSCVIIILLRAIQ